MLFIPTLEDSLKLECNRLGLSPAEFQQLKQEYEDDEELLVELESRSTPITKKLNLQQWLNWHGWKRCSKTHYQRSFKRFGFFTETITETKSVSDLIDEHLTYTISNL